ncbi:ParB N-terminal domain-containing protein [Acinetobacter baumannii]|uniref:ParB N-terminal domain-containing protein n=1 Tax=Acinetobacter baumannii TaxID=470 RepID=UPI003892A9E6
MKTKEIIQMPLKLISSSKKDDVYENIEALVLSIKKDGFLLPISVRMNPDKIGEFIVNLGENRFRAALALGLNTIPVYIEEAPKISIDFLFTSPE